MRNYEDNHTEFKSQLNDKLEKEMVAFLNSTKGGDIYIGIADNGAVVGVEEVDLMQLQISDRLKNNILPSCLGLFDIDLEQYEEKNVVHIIVTSGQEKPYSQSL